MLVAADLCAPRRPAFPQLGEAALSQGEQVPGLPVASLGPLFHLRYPAFQALEIGEHEFRFDGRDVGQRVDAALDMRHFAVHEAAHDMRDRVAFPDVGEKLIAEALAFRGAADEAGNVDKREPASG